MKKHTRTTGDEASFPAAWTEFLRAKARPHICVALGLPRQVVEMVRSVPLESPMLYQMDLHQAARVSALTKEFAVTATVSPSADLWDTKSEFQSIIFPVEPTGERELKLDIIEQAYHILKPNGTLIVLSSQENDELFPAALKKVFGRVHFPESTYGTVLWCQRNEESPRKRRRHEVAFQVSRENAPSLRFLSRPGTFSYGRFDNGARALVETAVINPGDRILDLGCGCGTNGIICGVRGPASHVTFIDSNCRATALTQLNAAANGLTSFDVLLREGAAGLDRGSFDVVLANPPYYANLSIAERFVNEARPLLKKDGRLYLVTKQPGTLGPMVADVFGEVEAVERRGYVVLSTGGRTHAGAVGLRVVCHGVESCRPQRS